MRDSFLGSQNKGETAKNNDKLRLVFSIGSEKEALDCYNFFIDYNHANMEKKKFGAK